MESNAKEEAVGETTGLLAKEDSAKRYSDVEGATGGEFPPQSDQYSPLEGSASGGSQQKVMNLSNSGSQHEQIRNLSSSGSFKNPSYEKVKAKTYAELINTIPNQAVTPQRFCCLLGLLVVFITLTIILLIVVSLFAAGVIRSSADSNVPTLMRTNGQLPLTLATVSDYEESAKQNLDPNAWLYYSSGATAEVTLRDNTAAFDRIRIHPDRQRDVSMVEESLSLETFGGQVSMPIAIAPTACHWWAIREERELATVQAAQSLNTVMIVSIDSSTITDDISKAAPGVILWQQMYIFKYPNDTLYMVDMAERSGCKALVLTIDKPAETLRYAQMRGQIVYPPDYPFGINYPPNMTPGSGYQKKRSWEDIQWLVGKTRLPVIVKGVLTAKEARKSIEMGASGIIVSNHGGRALDGTPASIDQLAEVVQAVGGRVPVYLDGGIRSGMDVFKALALGAKMVFVGRPVLYGLAHSGQAGVEAVFNILKNELVNTMQLAGTGSLSLITPDFVYRNNANTCPTV